jgi:integrase
MAKNNNRFRLARFAFETDIGETVWRRYITDRLIPAPVLNEWLETNYMGSAGTGAEYGKKLVVFLNYLDSKGIEYDAAANRDVKAFIMGMIRGNLAELKLNSPQNAVSRSTLAGYAVVITSFYRWLDENYETEMRFGVKRAGVRARKSFLYGQIYNYDYKYILGVNLPKLGRRREFIKWYTDDEIKALADHFLTLRDEAVFRVTLEGFRIDEVLSMRLSDYDPLEQSVQPSRSKGRETAVYGRQNSHRLVILPKATCELMDQYIRTERMTAENQSLSVSDCLFINLNRGERQGQALRYGNYYRIFKACAARAGLDPAKVRTHSGRSTKVMRMLEADAADTEIMYQTGWRRLDSIVSYRDDNNPIVARRVFQKLHPKDRGDKSD